MTTTVDRRPSIRSPMTPLRKTALIAGIACIATFVFSIPVKFGLWADVLDKPDFVLGAGSGGGLLWGAFFEVILAFACIATAVTLYTVAYMAAKGFKSPTVSDESNAPANSASFADAAA